jgi:hypothetical protein
LLPGPGIYQWGGFLQFFNQKSKIKNQKSIGCADLDLLTIKQFGFGPGDLSVGWLSSIL